MYKNWHFSKFYTEQNSMFLFLRKIKKSKLKEAISLNLDSPQHQKLNFQRLISVSLAVLQSYLVRCAGSF